MKLYITKSYEYTWAIKSIYHIKSEFKSVKCKFINNENKNYSDFNVNDVSEL